MKMSRDATFLSVTDYNSNLTCLANFVVLENSFLLVALQISCGSYPKNREDKETLKYYKFCIIYIQYLYNDPLTAQNM